MGYDRFASIIGDNNLNAFREAVPIAIGQKQRSALTIVGPANRQERRAGERQSVVGRGAKAIAESPPDQNGGNPEIVAGAL